MPVVVSEFEVVPDTSAQSASPPPGVEVAPPPPPPDVDRALSTRRARELRVRAY
jgi:hypothetical protein